MIRGLIIMLIAIFFDGCSFSSNHNLSIVHLSKNVDFKILEPWKDDKDITLNQHFQGSYNDNKYSLNLMTKLSKDKIKIIGLSDFGSRVFTMLYDGRKVDLELSSFVKSFGENSDKIKAEYILADMQLVYYPIDEIRKNIVGNVKIKEVRKNGIKRIFYNNDIPFIEISYSSDNILTNRIHYKNLERNYQYIISNLK